MPWIGTTRLTFQSYPAGVTEEHGNDAQGMVADGTVQRPT